MSYESILSKSLPDALDTWSEQTRWYSEFVQELKDALVAMHTDRDFWQTRYNNGRRNHENDVRLISEALIAEADARGWCDDYDKFVDALNGRLSEMMQTRAREYVVSAIYELKVSTTITARSIDEANDKAAEMELGEFNCSIRGDYDDCEYKDHDIEEA